MTYFEKSGPFTVCSIGGDFDSLDALFEAWRGKEQLEVNLPTAEAAREVCRAHSKAMKVAA